MTQADSPAVPEASSFETDLSILRGLRICFLAGTLGRGGTERQLFYVIKTLLASGAEVRLLSLTRGEFWEEQIDRLGIATRWIGRNSSPVVRLVRTWFAVHDCRPDVVQSAHFFTNLYTLGAARLRGIREIGAIRSNVMNELRGSGALFGKLCLQLPRTMVVNSRAAIETAVRLGVPRERLHLLRNVIDTDYFSSSDRPERDEARIIAVGRCVPDKRLDRFLSILSRVRQCSSRATKGIIVGDGPLRSTLEQQADKLGLLPDGVEFRGEVDDIVSQYQEADVLLLTSDWEGSPNVVLEAMASGLPVVASRVGGVPEVVSDGERGYLFGPEETDRAVGSLRDLVEDCQLRRAMGMQARRYAVNTHSLRRMPGLLAGLYRRVLN